jgi:hypothetical protein
MAGGEPSNAFMERHGFEGTTEGVKEKASQKGSPTVEEDSGRRFARGAARKAVAHREGPTAPTTFRRNRRRANFQKRSRDGRIWVRNLAAALGALPSQNAKKIQQERP